MVFEEPQFRGLFQLSVTFLYFKRRDVSLHSAEVTRQDDSLQIRRLLCGVMTCDGS